MKSITGRRAAVIYLCYFLLHLGFDGLARIFQVLPGVSLWYPPVGLALALATIFGLRCAPVVLAANLCSAFLTSSSPASWTQFALPVLITSVYVGTGALVRRHFGPIPAPAQRWRVTGLLALYLCAPLCSALSGTLIVRAGGHIGAGKFLPIAFSWWMGDLTGVLTILPLIMVHVAPHLWQKTPAARRVWTRRELLEILAQGATLLACLGLMHGFGYLQEYQTYYLSFVPLVWICLQHGLPGATIGILALTMGSLASLKLTGAPPQMVTNLLLFEIAVTAIGLGLGTTVTRRAHAENDRTRLLAILEATPDFVATADLTGRILYQNAAFLRLRGLAPSTVGRGRSLSDNHPPWAAELILQEGFPAALANGRWQAETAFLDAEGREVPVSQVLLAHYDQDREPVMLSTIARDISAEKKAEHARLESERNLLQMQKLDSLGVLAGGIAHDFNNLLTVMLGNAALARLDTPPDSPAEQSIHQVELAALRAAELCRQMLAYSGRGHLAAELVDLTTLVGETTNLLQVSISKKCRLEFALADDLPPVNGDSTQLSQIAMNLVMNASDASGEHGGRILVRTGLMEADRAYLAGTYLAPTITPGHFVFLEVSDEGCGMSAEVLARIFEPFFTTKVTGHGLGLSAVLGITRSHHGALKVESAPGRGTTFRLLLPVAHGTARAAAGESPAIRWRREGCVLIVDDEEPVREVAQRLLARLGFTTRAATNGKEAVEIFRRDHPDFCAVLLDLTMPVMGGEEAFGEIHRLEPALPVVLMSGYSESDSASRFVGQGVAGFLQKPFDSDRLSQALRLALNDNSTSPA